MSVNKELIAAVSGKRCLWDQKNKNYHNRHLVDKKWNEIAKELNQDAMFLKKKWKQLRDTFRAELRKRSGDPGPNGVGKKCSPWCHFNSMMFVKDQIKCRKPSGKPKTKNKTMEVEEPKFNANEEHNSVDMDASQYENPEYYVPYISTFEVETSTAQHHSGRNLTRCHDNMEPEMVSIEKKKPQLLEQKTKNRIQADDEDMAFFLSLLPHVMKMDPQSKLLCRMDIQKSVYNYVYNTSRSSQFQNKQSQSADKSVPSPSIKDSVSTQFSGSASPPQQPSP